MQFLGTLPSIICCEFCCFAKTPAPESVSICRKCTRIVSQYQTKMRILKVKFYFLKRESGRTFCEIFIFGSFCQRHCWSQLYQLIWIIDGILCVRVPSWTVSLFSIVARTRQSLSLNRTYSLRLLFAVSTVTVTTHRPTCRCFSCCWSIPKNTQDSRAINNFGWNGLKLYFYGSQFSSET